MKLHQIGYHHEKHHQKGIWMKVRDDSDQLAFALRFLSIISHKIGLLILFKMEKKMLILSDEITSNWLSSRKTSSKSNMDEGEG